jgi:hypothetical protein
VFATVATDNNQERSDPPARALGLAAGQTTNPMPFRCRCCRRLPGVAVVAGVVAADVPDALVAVLEDADAEEDADDERDHQHHEQEAPHVLLSPGELAHACVFPSTSASIRAVQVLQGLALLCSSYRRKASCYCTSVSPCLFDGMAMASNTSFVPCPASDRK